MAMGDRKKIIIDTDPGIDDAMAIFVALKSPEVDVIGLTTIYGNVYTTLATRNALHLLEVAGRTDIPVAEGTHKTILVYLCSVTFIYGLGNQNFPPPEGQPIEKSAPEFLVEQAKLHPGEITVVALGPLTNIALAVQLDPEFSKNVGQIVLLGGSFAVNGNVNPASEANVRTLRSAHSNGSDLDMNSGWRTEWIEGSHEGCGKAFDIPDSKWCLI
uniref:Inosine/uridine-preferring nucleoside hydrolase domain-containing protein n=1 Tax=Brassica oleracea var. oleracea TaxID=109376 RepID=A0A0D2ZTZ8_BRAOL